jgi:LL-diaminopimelate aminotransferase
LGRLAKLPPYLFSEIDAARRQAIAAGQEVVDLGIGDPDHPTPDILLQVMAAAIRRPASHRYPDDPGSPKLRQTIARWFEQRHGVRLDPERQVLVLVGSKEGLAHLPLALLAEGDEVLVPNPGYPVYAQATVLAGGVPRPVPLDVTTGFQPDPAELARAISARTRLMYLNYPHNPTGASATAETFRRATDLAAENGFVVVNDAAYLEVVLGGCRPPSLLSVAAPQEQRVLEFHSLSKMFNMTGWRIGFVVGHAELIRDLGRVKESIDSGVFTAIQEVAAYALGDDFTGLIEGVMAVYPPRRQAIVGALEEAGIEVFPTETTFYVWARVPPGETSVAFCRRVLAEHGVVLTPGVGFGTSGEGWFRISLTAADEQIATAAARLRRL